MVLYNTTGLDEATNIYQLLIEINLLSNNVLSSMFLLVFTIFLLVIFRNQGPFSRVALGVSFISSLIAIMLWSIGALSFTILLMPLVFLMIMIFINIFGGG